METVIVVWVSVDVAIIAERRTDGSKSESGWALLARGGRGAASENETPEAFYFRILDAAHHAHRILILGADGARMWLAELADSYSFMARRIDGVRYEPEGTAPALARHLSEALPAGDMRPARRRLASAGDRGSFRVEPRVSRRHDEGVERELVETGAAR